MLKNKVVHCIAKSSVVFFHAPLSRSNQDGYLCELGGSHQNPHCCNGTSAHENSNTINSNYIHTHICMYIQGALFHILPSFYMLPLVVYCLYYVASRYNLFPQHRANIKTEKRTSVKFQKLC